MNATAIDLPIVQIREICEANDVAELLLFGSILTDEFRPDSDVDFLVTFLPDASISLFDLAGLQIELADLLGRNVDLGVKRTLKPAIRDEVLLMAQVIYAA